MVVLLEAALQSAHVHRHCSGEPNCGAVLEFYNALPELTGSPVVAVNRALAPAENDGPQAGLEALDLLAEESRLGSAGDAAKACGIAIGLERDTAVREFLKMRKASLRE